MTEVLRTNAQDVASKVMEGEAILINLSTGAYYSLEGSAGLIWSLIEQGTTIDIIVEVVGNQYDVEADRVLADTKTFVGALTEEGLIGVGEVNDLGPESPEVSGEPGVYAAPVMEKFTDMVDMFALDPPLPGLGQQNG